MFEALYGWFCNTPISWSDPVNRVLIGLDMLAKIEQEMQVTKKNRKEAQDGKKSLAYQHKVFNEFQVGEHVYLCIKAMNISLSIRSCAKFTPWYCEPFKIIERIGPVAYQLAVPPKVKVHNVFHISFLKKYVKYVHHVIA